MDQLLGVAYSAITVHQTKWGLGLDQDSFPLENAIGFSRVRSMTTRPSSIADETQVQYAGGPVYSLAVLGFKVSLLAGYLRVAGFNRTYAIILYVALGLVTVSQLVFTFLFAFTCSPVARQWDPSIPGTCINALAMYFAFGGMSLAWDVLIIILPFPILRRLQLDKRNKVRITHSNKPPHHPNKVPGCHRRPLRCRLLCNGRASDSDPDHSSTSHVHGVESQHPVVHRRGQHGSHRSMRPSSQSSAQEF
jgi:hypothetical protein